MQEKRTQIKICGLTSEEEVRWVLEENVDYFGIVLFFPKSKRNISIEKAKQLIAVCREIHSRSDHDVVKSEVQKQRPRVVAVTVSPTPEVSMLRISICPASPYLTIFMPDSSPFPPAPAAFSALRP